MLDKILWKLEDMKYALQSHIDNAKLMLSADGRHRLGELALRRQIREILFPDDFIAWLEQNQDAVVGHATQSDSCPITNYIKASVPNLTDVATGSLDIVISDKKNRTIIFTLPAWTEDFIAHMDFERDMNEDIYGDEALEVMDQVMDRIESYQTVEFRDELDR